MFQAIFDRNRKDELPGLQLEWIDGICSPLYEVTLEDSPLSGLHCVQLVTHPPLTSVVTVLRPLLSSTDASNETVTNSYSTFYAATDFSLKKKRFFFLFYWKLWNNFKVASCSFENSSVSVHFLGVRKLRGSRVREWSCDVSRVETSQWNSVLRGSPHTDEISKDWCVLFFKYQKISIKASKKERKSHFIYRSLMSKY